MVTYAKNSHTGRRLRRVFDDPFEFTRFYWPDIRLYDKQLEVLYSVRDNIETFVHAGAALGKDFISSLAVLWFFQSRRPAKVIISSTSEDHLRTVLWGEIRERLATARFPMHLNVDYLRVRRWKDAQQKELEENSFVEGRVLSTVERFQGVHADNDRPRVFLIFDEASGIPDAFYDAAKSWFHRLLVIGNPLNRTNFFFKICSGGDKPDPTGGPGKLRHVIHIGSRHSPNVIWGHEMAELGVRDPELLRPPPEVRIPGVVSWQEHLVRRAEWDAWNLRTRDEGYFPEGESDVLYPGTWLDKAEDAAKVLEGRGRTRQGKAMGVDGGEGRALSAWTIIDELGIVHHEAFQTPDTTKIADNTLRLMRQFGVPAKRVFFDRGGGGKQIGDYLRTKKNQPVEMVSFGEPATPILGTRTRRLTDRKEVQDDQRAYKNRRAEMYYMLRERLNPDLNDPVFAIPRSMIELRREMEPMPLLYDDNGIFFMPPKNHPPGKQPTKNSIPTIMEILGHSPDRLDSLVLAVYGLQSRTRRKLGGIV